MQKEHFNWENKKAIIIKGYLVEEWQISVKWKINKKI